MIRLARTSSLPALVQANLPVFADRVQVKESFARAVKEWKSHSFSVDLSGFADLYGLSMLSDAVEGMLLGTYVPERYPLKERETWQIELLGLPEEAEAVVRETETLVQGVFWARDMTNRPGNLLRPADFVREIGELMRDLPVQVEILDAGKMEEMGFGAVLGVGMSSRYAPCFCILRYRGDPSDDRVIGLAGKGVTCDTGGYCLKSPSAMKGIKGDMAGGAAVAGCIYALAKNRAAVNVSGFIPVVENRLSDGSLLPGDVVTAYGGKTVEVIDTDAEGRLILADAVAYAARTEHVQRIVDIATLTGSICTTLGFGAAGAVCDSEELYKDFETAYWQSGERYLRLPVYAEYERLIESDIADVKNVGGKFAGSIAAGLFIRSFAEGTPWLHLDIAGTAWTDPPVFEYQTKGATGAGLSTMYYLCRNSGRIQ